MALPGPLPANTFNPMVEQVTERTGTETTARARVLLQARMRISSVLRELGIQQKAVAEEVGLSQSRVSQILSSKQKARKQGLDAGTKVYLAISKRLGIPLSELEEYREAYPDD